MTTSCLRRLRRTVLLVVPGVVLVSACGSSTPVLWKSDVEQAMVSRYATDNDMPPGEINVTCAGDLTGAVASTVECDVRLADGTAGKVEARVTSVDGNTINYDVAELP